jgi:hypothetical protein
MDAQHGDHPASELPRGFLLGFAGCTLMALACGIMALSAGVKDEAGYLTVAATEVLIGLVGIGAWWAIPRALPLFPTGILGAMAPLSRNPFFRRRLLVAAPWILGPVTVILLVMAVALQELDLGLASVLGLELLLFAAMGESIRRMVER